MVKGISYIRSNGVMKSEFASPHDSHPPRAARSHSEIRDFLQVRETADEQGHSKRRTDALHSMLMGKRQELLREIQDNVGQSLVEGQQRRLESAGDAGDQALMNRERDRSILVMERRNRTRQSLDEALTRLREGTYGSCAECGIDISEKRLQAVPFAKRCVACQSRTELLAQYEQAEVRKDS